MCDYTWNFPIKKRIIVIGDIHGDFNALIKSLKIANVIDNQNKWIGKDTYVVQLGDQIDRGGRFDSHNDENSELKIMLFLDNLDKEARKNNGRVLSLLGNHELMNVMGQMDYVSEQGIRLFGNVDNRRKMFAPGSNIAKYLACNRKVILKIGDFVFIHAGIFPNTIYRENLNDINNFIRRYLNGEKKLENDERFKKLYLNENSLLWYRGMSQPEPNCALINSVTEYLKIEGVIVGHTPQNNINSACFKKIWRVDTGMSNAFGSDSHNRIQVLEILNNGQQIQILQDSQ
jgi:hypothetical protein